MSGASEIEQRRRNVLARIVEVDVRAGFFNQSSLDSLLGYADFDGDRLTFGADDDLPERFLICLRDAHSEPSYAFRPTLAEALAEADRIATRRIYEWCDTERPERIVDLDAEQSYPVTLSARIDADTPQPL